MFSTYFTGLTLMASLIMPIGMQNAFVLNQGIRRRHHILVATMCSFADIFFMSLGVWGGAQLFNAYPWLLYSISILGAVFMLVYGYQCLRSAYQAEDSLNQGEAKHELKAIILACCAFTFLNPHVYIDTIVILGGFAANISAEQRPMFVAGGVSASFAWFFSLALLGAKLAPILAKPRAQQLINCLIGLMMFGLAFYLLKFVFA
ncbi:MULTISPECIES: LysE/ArgO family amino acid transporter [unclassified Agarivorans]|uniref:LysE/ArgO family amino acid transporter n=1 Tax=unclassified Agarivorans TaxID=2636026 RepID=UPI003D7E2758